MVKSFLGGDRELDSVELDDMRGTGFLCEGTAGGLLEENVLVYGVAKRGRESAIDTGAGAAGLGRLKRASPGVVEPKESPLL